MQTVGSISGTRPQLVFDPWRARVAVDMTTLHERWLVDLGGLANMHPQAKCVLGTLHVQGALSRRSPHVTVEV